LRNGVSVLDPNFADTGNFFAANQSTVNPELAFQWGSLLVQAEYNSSNFGGAAAAKGGTGLGNVRFQGGYCEALYFLTGENRIYNRQSGVFNRVIPIQNANIVKGAGFCGWGAWQVGARVDWLDLNSGLVNGGNLTNYTLGLNWFINPNVRFQFNYVYSMIDGTVPATFPGTVGSLNGARFGGHGNIDSFGCRMDYTF
jgi:phosphate-selective porin OprO/OprP